MRMSVITTSGSQRSMTANSSGRSDAVPTSSRSWWAATSRDTPSRSSTLSSASATLMAAMALIVAWRSLLGAHYSVRRISPVRSRAARRAGQAASRLAASRTAGPMRSMAHTATGGW